MASYLGSAAQSSSWWSWFCAWIIAADDSLRSITRIARGSAGEFLARNNAGFALTTRCALGAPAGMIAALQPALRGASDASNLYVSRTELHELLAEAFDSTRQGDSAAFHYRAVVKGWQRADPQFHQRRDKAAAWLARHTLRPPRGAESPL